MRHQLHMKKSRRCNRWQFECKSSGECIAIYNVCDRIPNCPDGSDESPELHCPANNGYAAGGGEIPLNPKQKQSSTLMTNHPQQLSQPQNHHPQPPVPINGGLEKGSILNGNDNGVAGVSKSQAPLRQPDEYPQLPKQQEIALGQMTGGESIINVPRKNDSPHFSHKTGGIMDELNGNHQLQNMHNYPYWPKQSQTYLDYPNSDPQSPNFYGQVPPPPQYSSNGVSYGNSGSYGNNAYQYGNGYSNLQGPPQQSPPQQSLPIMPQGQSQYPVGNSYNMPNNPQQQPQQQQSYYNGQPMQGNNNKAVVPPNDHAPAVQPANVQSSAGALTPPVQNVASPSNQQALPSPQQIVTSKATGKQQGAPKSSSDNNSSHQDTNSLSKLENEFIKSLKAQSFQSGSEVQSEELSPHTAGAGAVLIFILGLGMSIVMAIIVGCRLRRVGRRQRGKNRLDPDYLVDGMYL